MPDPGNVTHATDRWGPWQSKRAPLTPVTPPSAPDATPLHRRPPLTSGKRVRVLGHERQHVGGAGVLGCHPGCHPIGMDGVHPARRRASVWWLGSARRWRPARTRPAAVDNNPSRGLIVVVSRRELSTLITCARFSTRGVSVIEGYLEWCPSCYREQEGHRSIRVGVALRPLGHVGCWGSVPGRVVVWPPRCAQPPAPPMQLRPSRWRSSTAADHRWRPLVPCVYPAVVRPTDRAGHSVTGKHPVAAITAVRAVGVRLRGPKSLSASPASRVETSALYSPRPTRSRRSPRCLGGMMTTRRQRYVCFIPVGS